MACITRTITGNIEEWGTGNSYFTVFLRSNGRVLDSFVNIFLVVFSIALVGVMIALPVILLGTCIAIVDKQPTTFELVKVAIKGAVVIYLVPKFLKTIFLVYKVRFQSLF